MKLPIYDIIINDEDPTQGVGMISLVDDPAIGVTFIKLSKQYTFKADTEKQMLYGPFLIPNKLIYRRDNSGEYYVRFSENEIEKIQQKFNRDLNNRNINFMHTDEMVDAYVTENWIVDGEYDKSKNYGYDLTKGTWFGGVKVLDKDFWKDKVNGGDVQGFSVEILADLKLNLKNNNLKMANKKRKYIAKQRFDEAVEVEQSEVVVVAESIEAGQEVVVVMDDLSVTETYDGVVEIDEEVVTIVDGTITEVAPASEVSVEEVEESLQDEMPTGTVTAEQVNEMINSRMASVMEEISALKAMIGGQTTEMSKTFKKVLDEKLKTTPAVQSVQKKTASYDEKFSAIENRIKSFVKNKK